ncbi:hypothetical protein TNCT_281841 [Trichonephila clavata]|uniref:Uncharacterized protein n=1 Tax=Trichonephila clavata TaxID=2740835 RepID=A0A8X6H840_TRICU|nr:hypothetical protein TNCT_281841 [Trichonephila clavata]
MDLFLETYWIENNHLLDYYGKTRKWNYKWKSKYINVVHFSVKLPNLCFYSSSSALIDFKTKSEKLSFWCNKDLIMNRTFLCINIICFASSDSKFNNILFLFHKKK